MNSINEVQSLLNGSYCIGCGACSFGDDRIKIEMNDFGLLQPAAAPDAMLAKKDICPFTSTRNEDQIAKDLYAGIHGISHTKELGYHLGLFAGHVNESDYREKASSGGMTTWILDKLLSEGKIDGIVHVGRGKNDDRLFEYMVSRTTSELRQNSKSRYYPVNFDLALDSVLAIPGGRYAFVGVPCHIKAVRLLCESDARLNQAFVYFIGIFCGHQKSAAFSELLAWQLGIRPGLLKNIDFRAKDLSLPANKYAVEIADQGIATKKITSQRLYGSDWGLGFFKPKACEWCDDVSAETADIVLGDAWLQEYVQDSRGNNVVITRDPYLHDVILKSIESGCLKLDKLTPERIIESQAANYRHRHEGLSVRINHAKSVRAWHPEKRVKVTDYTVSRKRERLYLLREKISERSHIEFLKAKERGSLLFFVLKMIYPEIRYYSLLGGMRGGLRATRTRLRMVFSFLYRK